MGNCNLREFEVKKNFPKLPKLAGFQNWPMTSWNEYYKGFCCLQKGEVSMKLFGILVRDGFPQNFYNKFHGYPPYDLFRPISGISFWEDAEKKGGNRTLTTLIDPDM